MCRFLVVVTLICASALNGAPSALAQTYPTRTVRFIIPFGPASASDITARLFADRLTTRWGKPVVVENRPGGDGLVAIGAFTGANDDHTLLFGPAGTFAVHPYEYDKLPYDADRDLLPISNVSTIILSFSTPESLKLGSIGDFVALARANPGTLNAAAASGNADFLLFGFLKSSGLQVAKVPYRDILQAPNDLAEGRIQALMTSLAVVRPQMQAGRVKVLAVTSSRRAPTAPEIPTVAEAGYPSLQLESVVGLFGPRGMPADLRERVAAENYRQLFTDRTTARHIVFCYSLLSAVNTRKLELAQKQKNDPSSLTNIENASLSFLNKKGANYLLVHVISQCMETILGKPIPNRFDLHFSKNVSPNTAAKFWLPIIDMMLSLSNQLQSAFSRNRISNESISKAVPNFVGVVASISGLQKETFEKFASNTKVGL